MSDFRQLSQDLWASPQISTEDVTAAHEMGINLIINNRPEGESDDQTPGPDIEEAARSAGISYCEIPVSHAGFSQSQVSAMREALENSGGKTLAYCRSGTRSTFLWALARSSMGDNPDSLARQAAAAGYDLAPVREAMAMLAAHADE